MCESQGGLTANVKLHFFWIGIIGSYLTRLLALKIKCAKHARDIQLNFQQTAQMHTQNNCRVREESLKGWLIWLFYRVSFITTYDSGRAKRVSRSGRVSSGQSWLSWIVDQDFIDSNKRVQHCHFRDKHLTLFLESVDSANVLCAWTYLPKPQSW